MDSDIEVRLLYQGKVLKHGPFLYTSFYGSRNQTTRSFFLNVMGALFVDANLVVLNELDC